jgi:hypothetical protein
VHFGNCTRKILSRRRTTRKLIGILGAGRESTSMGLCKISIGRDLLWVEDPMSVSFPAKAERKTISDQETFD